MNPKYIFISFFAVASLLSYGLPQLNQTIVSPAAISAPAEAGRYADSSGMLPDSQVKAVYREAPVAGPAEAPAVQESGADSIQPPSDSSSIPLTSYDQSAQVTGLPDLGSFIASVTNSDRNALVGVYAPGLFALKVVQQPSGDENFVSPLDYTLTQYAAPSQYGSTAILAHNYLSGKNFFSMAHGQEVLMIFGDGSLERFLIEEIASYQALDPNNPYSDFVDLSDPGARPVPYSTVFQRFYTQYGQVVFQTCIEYAGNPSWGRIFIVARPV